MTKIPFSQRFGLEQSAPVADDFPESARIALAHLLVDLEGQHCLKGWSSFSVPRELLRTGRFIEEAFGFDDGATFFDRVVHPLRSMEWWQVYTFCERLYDRHIGDAHAMEGDAFDEYPNWVVVAPKPDMLKYYSEELNNILDEENLAYRFVDGQFQRRGRAQTQKSVQRVGAVLADPSLARVRNHYNKARRFFDERPEPDVENCVKEALCALEASLEILTGKPASKEFVRVVKQLQGNGERQIPPPVAEGIIKLHAYRGSAQGVAHAATQGNRVSEIEAELVLSLVASYVTYLVDLFPEPEQEIPF